MAVITISRQFGAGGWTLGEKLAERFGYRYIHEDMIKEIAAKTGSSSDRIRAIEERGTDRLLNLIDRFVTPTYVERLTSDKYGYLDEKIYVETVRAILKKFHEQGDVVIIGRGGQYILREFPDTYLLLLVADLSHRVQFVMNKYRLSETEAEKVVKKRDQIRSRFLSLFSETERHDDPALYDMVLNMNRIPMEKAEQLVEKLIFG